MRGKKINYKLLDSEVPAFSDTSIEFLEKAVRKDHVVFEWGSGASTFWFADRCHTIWSVEYFKLFYDELVERAENRINVNLILKEPDETKQEVEYIAKNSSASGYSFKAFAHSIDTFKDRYFDWIVIDGRARPKCLELALPKLRLGGSIIFDDSERGAYFEAMMKHSHYFDGIMQFSGVTIDKKRNTTSILYKKK